MPPFTNQFAGVLSPCITGITALATYDYGGKIRTGHAAHAQSALALALVLGGALLLRRRVAM